MSFLTTIMEGLRRNSDKPILLEVHGRELRATTCCELLAQIDGARAHLRAAGLQPGDRCALLAPNSVAWVAVDLAIMGEKAIVVPLYTRQAPEELIAMLKDCTPRLLVCATTELREAVTSRWPDAPHVHLLADVFSSPPLTKGGLGRVAGHTPAQNPEPESSSELHAATHQPATPPTPPSQGGEEVNLPAAIIYTSGTSGEAKGVVLTHGNLSFMVAHTSSRLPDLIKDVKHTGDDRVFHYLPLCFAGSWIMLLTCLYRTSALTLCLDLTKLQEELQAADPHYFLNVPAFLERVRNGVLTKVRGKGGLARWLFERCQDAYLGRLVDLPSYPIRKRFWGIIGHRFVFPKIKRLLGRRLQCLLCGSAPLAVETQRFFEMLGLPVLQIYGLTETTAICTMDDPGQVSAGHVGRAIPGIEMKHGENDEILVRGKHIFPGYWNRPQATAEIVKDGWLHTGDQASVDPTGNWKIIGRIKNLIITTGGHNISPEPIEELLLNALPEAEHVMLVGNDRKCLAALLTGKVAPEHAQAAIDHVNHGLPHYKQVRKFICVEPFTAENGLLTANRKLRRAAIEVRFRAEIDHLYEATG